MKFKAVEILSMDRVDIARAVAQIIVETPLKSVKPRAETRGIEHQLWEKQLKENDELQVKMLMKDNIGSAMQFLKSKTFQILSVSFSSTNFCSHNHCSKSYNWKPFESEAPS